MIQNCHQHDCFLALEREADCNPYYDNAYIKAV
jgi:hypothetical protein